MSSLPVVVSIDDLRSTQSDVTISVPSDFDTLNQTILNNYRATTSDLSIEIIIESGHAILEPVSLAGGDYSHISVISEDTTVPVDGSFPSDQNVIQVHGGATSPSFGLLIDCQGNGNHGMVVKEGAAGILYADGDESNRGIKNAAGVGVSVGQASRLFSYGPEITNSGQENLKVRADGRADIGGTPSGGTLTEAGTDNIQVFLGGTLRAINLDATNAGKNGLRVASGGRVVVSDSDFSDATENGVYVSDGRLSGRRITSEDNDGTDMWGVLVEHADVNVSGGTIGGYGVSSTGADVTFENGTLTNGELNIRDGGILRCTDTVTPNSTGSIPHQSDMATSPNSVSSDGIIFANDFEQ